MDERIILRNTVSKLSRERCSIHGKSAEVKLMNNNIQISNICCNNFEKKLNKKAEDIIAKETEKHISDSIKKLFK
jgi:hypothetical protein